jgi:DNA mismatch endonuclease (patch repair protein)
MERALRAHLPGGKFEGTTPQRSRTMQAVRGTGNRTTERRLRLGLVRAGAKGWKVRPVGLAGKPDFFFASRKLAVFVDGCFWHGCPRCGHLPRSNSAFWKAKIERNRERDKRTSANLREQGISVVRFWEHELQNQLEKCIEKISGQP